jgi:nicotinate-nucleotide pyrophosphorylase (carboxylating)
MTLGLPRLLVEPIVRNALVEDLGRSGDITTDSIVPAQDVSTMMLQARQPGVVAGLDLALLAYELVDPRVQVKVEKPDGSRIAPGDVIALVHGPSRGILTGERVALNFLCHMSGIASATATIMTAIQPHKARVVCTRKTMPGLRIVQKYAVRVGGGANHRFGLDDAVLIKDNHIAVAGGVRAAVARARQAIGHLVKIEVEVDTLEQLEELIPLGVDAVLLDNMGPETLKIAVDMIAGRMISEASGRVTAATAPAIAASGVDLISIGWLTHSATVLDIGLDYVGA